MFYYLKDENIKRSSDDLEWFNWSLSMMMLTNMEIKNNTDVIYFQNTFQDGE